MKISLALILCLALAQSQEFNNPLENVLIGGSSRFGRPSGTGSDHFTRARIQEDDWSDLWTETGTVPQHIAEVPDKLFVSFPSGISIRPNDTITSGLMLQIPKFDFEPRDTNALHTLVMFDMDVVGLGPSPNFMHYVIVNIPGNKVEQGEEVITFLPSFTFDFDPARGIIEDSTLTHRYLWLVYQQSGPLNLEPEGDFCQPEKIGARQKPLNDFVLENGLDQLIAGNFHRNRYSGDVTKAFICFASKCIGQPWPALFPGVNDLDECQVDSSQE